MDIPYPKESTSVANRIVRPPDGTSYPLFMSSERSSSVLRVPPSLRDEAFVDEPENVEAHDATGREVLEEWAHSLLVDRMGGGDDVSTAHAYGVIAVQADQTHYSDGFGLFMSLRQGVAVAARRADASRVVFAGRADEEPPEDRRLPWVAVVQRLLHELIAEEEVEVAVVSTVPGTCRDGYLAALAVATTRVVRALDVSTTVDLSSVQDLRDELVPFLAAEIGAAFDCPYSSGYVLATFAGAEPAVTLVDTATREHLPVETEARSALRWAVIHPHGSEPPSTEFHRRRQRQAGKALEVLRANGFASLTAFRDLEHRDLVRAVSALPDSLRPVARHLVTENRRVQKHVLAMRRSDWQMVGGLLLMSHASQRDNWESTTRSADAVVEEVEAETNSALYGACMTGRAGAVLVAGRPGSFGHGLRRLSDAVTGTLGEPPRILVP